MNMYRPSKTDRVRIEGDSEGHGRKGPTADDAAGQFAYRRNRKPRNYDKPEWKKIWERKRREGGK